jgi:L-ribulose-5-phosphate 3-epimerase
MKVSVNMWAFSSQNLQNLLENYSNSCFHTLELNCEFDSNSLLPLNCTREKLKNITRLLFETNTTNLSISSICSELHWQYSLSSNQDYERNFAIEIGKKMILYAYELRAKSIVIIPGIYESPSLLRKNHSYISIDDVFYNAKESLLELSDFAYKYNITLGVENVCFNNFLNSPDDFLNFLKFVNRDNIKVHLDIGNANLTTTPILEWIEKLNNNICAIHIKDSISSDKTLNTFKPLLEGDIDWCEVIKKLKSINYENYLILEHSYSNGKLKPDELYKRIKTIINYGKD